MSKLGILYENRSAQQFRAAIRPSLVGNLGKIEPVIAERAAEALALWMVQVIQNTVRSTTLRDKDGEIYKQLMAGIRIYGRASLNSLRAVETVYPWLYVHEFGADIEPQNGSQYLTIPIFYALRPDGSVKFRNAAAWKRFGSFVYKAKDDRLFLAYKSKETGELRILYRLIDKVTIPRDVPGFIRNANAIIGELWAVWTQIYISEASDPKYGIFELWGGGPD